MLTKMRKNDDAAELLNGANGENCGLINGDATLNGENGEMVQMVLFKDLIRT